MRASSTLLGEEERAVLEVEGGQHLAHPFLAGTLPVQPPGDHQMDDEEEVLPEVQHQALADPAGAHDRAPLEHRDRRIVGTQDEGARDPEFQELAADHVPVERLHVDGDVR
jgi:hypothetical protein